MNTTSENETSSYLQFRTGQVTSADGTIIGYRQIGHGPGLVIMHGGARASQHYTALAELLADLYTVYIPDRRGRGLSGPPGDSYSIEKEFEDLNALLQKTGATFLFGHSAGGFFALEAALRLPVSKLALYEPAVSIHGSLPLDWFPSFEQALSRNDNVPAMVIFLKGLRLHRFLKLPAWALTPVVRLMLRTEEGQEMAKLLPTLVWEVKEFNLNYREYRKIQAETLLLGGSKSPEYLLYAVRSLAKTIPNSRQIVFPDLDHNAPDQNAPGIVAKELKEFFS